jgi:hypothetical protein
MSDKARRNGLTITTAIAVGILLGVVGPTSAQFFNFGGFQQRPQPQRGSGWFGNDIFEPFQQPTPQPPRSRRQTPAPVREDFSRAPAPQKRQMVPQRHILVLGDAMADWLGYGLEEAYSEQSEMGVIRKPKTVSGLIRYQPKGEPADWIAAARGILASEKPDVIVVMLGLSDRMSMHEPPPDKTDGKPATDKNVDKKAETKDAPSKPQAMPGAEPNNKPSDDELTRDAADVKLPVKRARTPNSVYEFRDQRWVELYNNKIDEMIGVLGSKGIPVLWVGLPAVRGSAATADTLFLDALYRDAVRKAGITYVDVWDGFVDEAGHFLQKGPDFEGQIRQLRSSDGVYFTRAGALKLAHYVEREITRVLAARAPPVALPTEPATPDTVAIPGQAVRRPLAGPILPLLAPVFDTDQLLGGPGSSLAPVDPLVARALIKGEALKPPAGRADDFAWPRGEIGREPAEGPNAVASAAADRVRDGHALMMAPARPLKPKRR